MFLLVSIHFVGFRIWELLFVSFCFLKLMLCVFWWNTIHHSFVSSTCE